MCTIDSFVPRPKFSNNVFRKTFENDIQYFIIFMNTDYIIFDFSIFFTIVLRWAENKVVLRKKLDRIAGKLIQS